MSSIKYFLELGPISANIEITNVKIANSILPTFSISYICKELRYIKRNINELIQQAKPHPNVPEILFPSI